MKLELFLSKGESDYLWNIQTEDRFIIVDSDGFDVCGEHFSKKEAKECLKTLKLDSCDF